MRVLNVLRHWISKHFQDFEQDETLRAQTVAFLDDITCSPNLLPSEHRAASQLLRLLCREDLDNGSHILESLLQPPLNPSKENIETLSALEIAEQMTYLDHQIFSAIRSEEFLGQAWMKSDKKSRAEHIILMTKRFNDGSRLVVAEIVSRFVFLKISKLSNIFKINFTFSGHQWLHVLLLLKSGLLLLIFVDVCTILMECYKFALLLQILLCFDSEKLGIKYRKLLV